MKLSKKEVTVMIVSLALIGLALIGLGLILVPGGFSQVSMSLSVSQSGYAQPLVIVMPISLQQGVPAIFESHVLSNGHAIIGATVDFILDGTNFGQAVTDSSGKATITWNLPMYADNGHDMKAIWYGNITYPAGCSASIHFEVHTTGVLPP